MTEQEERERLRYLQLKAKASAGGAPATPTPAAATEDPGFLRTLVTQAAQGATKGFSDELAGAIAKATQPEQVGVTGGPAPKSTYDITRDVARREAEAGFKARPVASTLANVGGEMLSDALLQRLGVPVGSLPYQVAAGAAGGLGRSEAETAGGQAFDAALGGGLGAAGNLAGRYVLGPIASKVGPRLKKALESFAEDKARRVLLAGADALSTRAPTSTPAVREALESAIVPFGTTQGTSERLSRKVVEQEKLYGALLDRLEALGVTGPRAQEVATELVKRGNARSAVEMSEALPREFYKQAENITEKVPASVRAKGGQELGLRQAEALKRSLQRMAKYGRFEETPLNEVRREIASVLREANEQAVEQAGRAAPRGSEVSLIADEFTPMKQRLGRLYEAEAAAERGAAHAARRLGPQNPLPGAIAAAAAGAPGADIALRMTRGVARNRLPSALAAGAHALSKSSAVPAIQSGQLPSEVIRSLYRPPGDDVEALIQALRGGAR